VNIAFSSNRFERECTDGKHMVRAYGDRAKPLKLRISLLRQARNLDEVPKTPPPRCHMLGADRKGQFSVTLKDNWRLIFIPTTDPLPRLADGGLDLTKVTDIELVEVVDYHGN
jgi:proteic killer suppression protein